ncbi:MAG: hydrogenase formation protein HypD [Desulfovibrionales bacterium]|nr:hydrogenase formation protein HypD [Desulfovibrionales bacterium]
MSLLDSFKDPHLCQAVLERIHAELHGELRFMEVCGTHTVSIFRSGVRSLLPENVVHLSGPGCPVCVTHDSEVALFLELAGKNAIIATFGDLMRVPGPEKRTLKTAQAEGARVRIVYSPFEAIKLAQDNPNDKVVFLGVGFETTAPAIAATLKTAREEGVHNFSVLSFHKLVPPALHALAADPELQVQAFLLPGHVSAIIGVEPYRFLAQQHGIPAVVAGFEPLDILQALHLFVTMRNKGQAEVINAYTRVVADAGNTKAMAMLNEVFMPADALWRGIGLIPGSGLVLRPEYAAHDAMQVFDLTLRDVPQIKGCQCGDVLKGKISPDQCVLFGKACTPAAPVGPCMVSTEGSCAAYFKYRV